MGDVFLAFLIGGSIGAALGGLSSFLIYKFTGNKLKPKTQSVIIWIFVILGYAVIKAIFWPTKY